MLRMDAAGNVSKRFSAGGFSISRYGGAAAWSVVNADQHPGNLGVDKVQLPDGGTFLTLAKSIRKGLPQAGRAQRRLTVVLGCSDEFAEQVVYADGLEAQEPGPIGTNCRLCPPSTMRAPRLPGLDHDPLNFCMRGISVAFGVTRSLMQQVAKRGDPHWAGQELILLPGPTVLSNERVLRFSTTPYPHHHGGVLRELWSQQTRPAPTGRPPLC